MACCDDSVFDPKNTNWAEQIRCLKCEIDGLRFEIENAGQSVTNFSSKLGSTLNIFKGMMSTVNNLRKSMASFTKNTQAQYDLAEKIAKSYKNAGLEIGIAVGRSEGFSRSFKGAVADIARFGGELDDAQRIYTDFADSSGRVRILGEDEVSNIFQLGKAANLYGSEATNLYETLDLMGVSNQAATERMTDLIIDSQKIGLNSSKVVKVLANNMKLMQSYSFAGGVRGMTEMAKLGVKLRTDVSTMLSMADKFYQPEAAIEAAANLQMLGGDIAEAFGDPFETMYLARNKPEELAKKLQGMTENMMTLNKKTGEYEFPPEVRMQLKSAGEQLGINTDQMIEMTRQTSKMKDIKDKLSMKGMFSDKEMEGIASMARMEGGEFKVDIYNDSGNKLTKSIDELSSGDVEMLMKVPTDQKDYMTKMIDNSMTTNELLSSIDDSFQKQFVKGFDPYKLYESSSKETLAATRDMMNQSISGLIDTVKTGFAAQMVASGVETMEELDKTMAEHIRSLEEFVIENPEEVIIKGGNVFLGEGTNLNPNDGSGSAGTNFNPGLASESYCKSKGRKWNSATGQCDPAFAKGGVVTKPMNALVGEGGQPEAIFPLSKLRDFLGDFNAPKKMSVDPVVVRVEMGRLDINGTDSLDMEALKPQIVELIKTALNGSMFNQKRTGNAIDNFG